MSPGYIEINLEYAMTRKETAFPREISVGLRAEEAAELAEALLELANEGPVNDH